MKTFFKTKLGACALAVVLPVLLGLLLILSPTMIQPQVVSAAEPTVIEWRANSGKTLNEIFAGISSDTTVKLMDNAELIKGLVVAPGSGVNMFSVVVDMNGKTINYRYKGYDVNDNNKPIPLDSGTVMTFGAYQTVTIKGGGEIICEATGTATGISSNSLKLNIEGGLKIDAKCSSTSGNERATGVAISHCVLTIDGANINVVGKNLPRGISATGNEAKVDIKNIELTSSGYGIISNSGAEINVTDGTITVEHETEEAVCVYTHQTNQDNANVSLSGGTFEAIGDKASVIKTMGTGSIGVGSRAKLHSTSYYTINIRNNADLSIRGGFVHNDSATTHAVYAEGLAGTDGSSVNILGGTVVSGKVENKDTTQIGLYNDGKKGVTIIGGSVSGISVAPTAKIKNYDGTIVTKKVLKFKDISTVLPVSDMLIAGVTDYGTVGVQTDENGKIYIWTDATAKKITATLDGKNYEGVIEDINNTEMTIVVGGGGSGGGGTTEGGSSIGMIILIIILILLGLFIIFCGLYILWKYSILKLEIANTVFHKIDPTAVKLCKVFCKQEKLFTVLGSKDEQQEQRENNRNNDTNS